MIRRGFVLSLDALLAVLILVMFITGFAFYSAQSSADPFAPLIMKKIGGDMLTSLDKGNVLQSMNATYMNRTLNATLYPSATWRLEVFYYNYSGGFLLSSSINVSETRNTPANPSVSEREFVVMANNRVKHYGYARLTLWPN
jgi:hypothetical protein